MLRLSKAESNVGAARHNFAALLLDQEKLSLMDIFNGTFQTDGTTIRIAQIDIRKPNLSKASVTQLAKDGITVVAHAETVTYANGRAATPLEVFESWMRLLKSKAFATEALNGRTPGEGYVNLGVKYNIGCIERSRNQEPARGSVQGPDAHLSTWWNDFKNKVQICNWGSRINGRTLSVRQTCQTIAFKLGADARDLPRDRIEHNRKHAQRRTAHARTLHFEDVPADTPQAEYEHRYGPARGQIAFATLQ